MSSGFVPLQKGLLCLRDADLWTGWRPFARGRHLSIFRVRYGKEGDRAIRVNHRKRPLRDQRSRSLGGWVTKNGKTILDTTNADGRDRYTGMVSASQMAAMICGTAARFSVVLDTLQADSANRRGGSCTRKRG